MYILVNGNQYTYPYSQDQLRRDNPGVSFPMEMTDETCAAFNVYPVNVKPIPTYDSRSQAVTQQDPIQINGEWTQDWNVMELSDEEKQQIIQDNGSNVRVQRDMLLAETDWYVIKSLETGNPVPANVLVYRQALRDITLQEGFPFDVVWPTL